MLQLLSFADIMFEIGNFILSRVKEDNYSTYTKLIHLLLDSFLPSENQVF